MMMKPRLQTSDKNVSLIKVKPMYLSSQSHGINLNKDVLKSWTNFVATFPICALMHLWDYFFYHIMPRQVFEPTSVELHHPGTFLKDTLLTELPCHGKQEKNLVDDVLGFY